MIDFPDSFIRSLRSKCPTNFSLSCASFQIRLKSNECQRQTEVCRTSSVNLRLARRRARMQEIKVATLICLSHVRGVQRAEAAFVSRRFRIPLRAPPGQFVIADPQTKVSLRNVQFDQ